MNNLLLLILSGLDLFWSAFEAQHAEGLVGDREREEMKPPR